MVPDSHRTGSDPEARNRLRGTRHGVSRQTPPSMTERNQFAMNTYKDKRIDFNNKAHLNNGKLFVKGKVQTEFLEPGLPDPEPAEEDYEVEVTQSGTIKDSGSVFKGYAVSVNSLSDVTSGIQEVMMSKNGQSVSENFHSDDDHGMGLDLWRMLRDSDKRNVLCLVSREYAPGFQHLGRKRFEIQRPVGKEALDKL